MENLYEKEAKKKSFPILFPSTHTHYDAHFFAFTVHTLGNEHFFQKKEKVQGSYLNIRYSVTLYRMYPFSVCIHTFFFLFQSSPGVYDLFRMKVFRLVFFLFLLFLYSCVFGIGIYICTGLRVYTYIYLLF